jgi:hypothetical protein
VRQEDVRKQYTEAPLVLWTAEPVARETSKCSLLGTNGFIMMRGLATRYRDWRGYVIPRVDLVLQWGVQASKEATPATIYV